MYSRRRQHNARGAWLVIAVATVALPACTDRMKREQEEIAKSSIACKYNDELLLIRFDMGEARMLIAATDRVTLYQIASPPGTVRYMNGSIELRGKGMELQLIRDGVPGTLVDCQPVAPPK
jgi:hypothetical protein